MTRNTKKFSVFETYLPPHMTRNGIEISVHSCPRSLSRELSHVFRGNNVDFSHCLAIPTNQRATANLVEIGDHIENEKDRLLNNFVDFAAWLCKEVESKGFWADYIDPCSGLPMISGGNHVYSEVEGMQLLLQYQVMNAGCCKVLLHPSWGSAVYPATCFVCAPYSVLEQILKDILND